MEQKRWLFYDKVTAVTAARTAEKYTTTSLHFEAYYYATEQFVVRVNLICAVQCTIVEKAERTTFKALNGGPQRLGVQLSQDGDIIDVSGVDSTIPNGLVQLLQAGPNLLDRTKRVVGESKSVVPLSQIRLLPPITSPSKVVCVGLNYSGHCDEQNVPYPKEPVFFSKFSSCIALDWEVELAIVIGKTAKDVKPSEAIDHIFGFTVAQDITARDWQKGRNGGQWLLGKSMDTFCPLGPAVVIKEAVGDINNLGIRSKINGVLKQEGSTSELIHKIDFIVSFLSQ
uniref:Fumarylacetoacetase-like C-terminal domain-containing protein n=1 Tax=Timema tahoe TaxID=61484 RepID=A0A7R9FK00_9NEOP|nr:unnamed protein product [Timema tahoe]